MGLDHHFGDQAFRCSFVREHTDHVGAPLDLPVDVLPPVASGWAKIVRMPAMAVCMSVRFTGDNPSRIARLGRPVTTVGRDHLDTTAPVRGSTATCLAMVGVDPVWKTHHMRPMNSGQRIILVIGLGLGLVAFGDWATTRRPGLTGWTGYSPLQVSNGLDVPGELHPWVRLLIWLAVIVVWMVASAWLLRSRSRMHNDSENDSDGRVGQASH